MAAQQPLTDGFARNVNMAANFDLDTPVQYVRGVGPVRSRLLENLGIVTARDLLHHFPFRYEKLPRSTPIGHLVGDEVATIIAEIRKVKSRGPGGGAKPSVVVNMEDGTGRCRVRWFNAAYVAEQLRVGDVLRVSGKVVGLQHIAEFVNPTFEILDDRDDPFQTDDDRFVPVYSVTEGIDSKTLRRIILAILPQAASSLVEFIPDSLRRLREFPLRRTAVLRLHQPTGRDDIRVARRRLAYEELLLLQLGIQGARRTATADQSAKPIPTPANVHTRIRARLPFELTPGQESAVREILTDLDSQRPMNRLLQGDVGSGKTAVAVYAALATIAERHQVSMLAPTEILAQQHFQKVSQYLDGSRVRVGLLTGNIKTAERASLVRATAAGEIDWLIGTHALIEKDVTFADLGLVIIDEQHKFGVSQRIRARGKQHTPHCLIMSATPIPRTLAMTYFGDLDFSTIPDLPAGRRTIRTHRVRSSDLSRMWKYVADGLRRGEQAYVVYPLIAQSEALELKSATVEFEQLRQGPLREFNIGLIHGRLPPSEKDRVVADFRQGRLHALVSTTVIEVGVDVPNATMMVIEQAERFGLSQLHQLRGRVGRGSKESHCFVVSDAAGDVANDRLAVLCNTQNGFDIAEQDLRLRGPGEFLGLRQHGIPELKVADLTQDVDLLNDARNDAASILESDPGLQNAIHTPIRQELARRFGSAPFVSALARA